MRYNARPLHNGELARSDRIPHACLVHEGVIYDI